jgi:hypothetical protein
MSSSLMIERQYGDRRLVEAWRARGLSGATLTMDAVHNGRSTASIPDQRQYGLLLMG